MTRGAPLTYDKPERRAERAEKHWCDDLGSVVYQPRSNCPYCRGGSQS